MPQVFQILRCFKCFIFQVQQVKKSNKWECKVCGEKQSIKRHYGIGTAKDCRLHVQKLNSINGEITKTELESDGEEYENSCRIINSKCNTQNLSTKKMSKWSSYIDETEENIQDSKDVLPGHDSLKSPKKCNKKNKRYGKPNNDENCETGATAALCPLEIVENHSSDLNFDDSSFQVVDSDSRCISSDIFLSTEEQDVASKDNVCKPENALRPVVKISKWQQFLDKKENENCFENEATDTVAVDFTKRLAYSPHYEQECFKIDKESVSVNSKLNSIFSVCDDSDIDDILKL